MRSTPLAILCRSLSVLLAFLTLTTVFVLGTHVLLTSPASASTAKQSNTIALHPEQTTVPSALIAPTLFLPLVVRQQQRHDPFTSREVLPELVAASNDHIGHSPISIPKANSYTFVADSGGDLDQYLYRQQVAGGNLNFTINITAPIVPSDTQHVVDGWLTVQGLEYMKSQRKLSDLTLLQLQVYDVDHDAPGCAEVDHIWVNGHLVEHDGMPTVLRGGDDKWDSSSIFIPTYFLRFPLDPGGSIQDIQPAPNEIAIEIDTLQCDFAWALEVDWGALIVRPSIDYGLFFIHGWTGSVDTFVTFSEFAEQDGYMVHGPEDYYHGIEPLTTTAILLKDIISATTAPMGNDKVFIVAHSRGGLFTRSALRSYQELAAKVAGYITLSTPNHGENSANNFYLCSSAPVLQVKLGSSARKQLNHLLETQCRSLTTVVSVMNSGSSN